MSKNSFVILSLIFILIIFFAGCVSQQAPPSKNISAPAEETVEKEAQPQDFGTKIGLVPEIPESAQIEVKRFYGPGICYLASVAALENYYDSTIDLNKALLYSISTRFEQTMSGGGYGPAPLMTSTVNEIKNLGFTQYAAVGEDVFDEFAPGFIKTIDSGNKIKFNSQEESFAFLKRLVASKVPVVVTINLPLLFPQMGGSDYLVVHGYDKDYIYVNLVFDAPDGTSGENYKIPVQKFLEIWGTFEPNSGMAGPNFMLWVKKTGTPKTESEIVLLLKAEAQKAPANELSYASILRNGASLQQHLNEAGYYTRTATADFLGKKGLSAAAAKYRESAALFNELNFRTTSGEAAIKLEKIATAEEQAYALWV